VKENQDMSDKICMVTGATDGIGVPTAHALANMGAHVVAVGRNREKSEKVVEKIKRETGNPKVEYILADFSDLAQVRNLAQEFKRRHSKLHILVNNAGVLMITRRYSVDGYEMMFAVNHLAHFLLTMLVLDTIKSSAPARIVNVSSGSHRRAELDFDDLHGKKRFHPGTNRCDRQRAPPGVHPDQHGCQQRLVRTPCSTAGSLVVADPRAGSEDEHLPGLLAGSGGGHRKVLHQLQGGQIIACIPRSG
jgi:hypothetical protein